MSFRAGNRAWWAVESHQGLSKLIWKSTIFEESRHMHSFRYPKIDMTTILGSFPGCFLEAHQCGSEPGLVLLPYRLNFGCHFQKPWQAYWCLLCFNNWRGEKKVQINVPKCVCHEAATREDVSLDAIVNLASKRLSINSFVGLLKWNITSPLSEKRKYTAVFESMPWDPQSSSGSEYSDFSLFLF